MHKLKSFLGSQSELKGDLSSKGILRLDGTVIGNIYADQVILSETSVIKGAINAARIIVGGLVEGVLRAEDMVEIRAKGKVNGEIFTKRFVVLNGGEFNGRIEMKAEIHNVVEFESRRISHGGQ
jgi:cytoskeletal protein CcmA (bactofilin family)